MSKARTFTIELGVSRGDQTIGRWLASQADPSAAVRELILAHLSEKKKVAAELADLRHQVRVLCDVLDRVTAQAIVPRPVGMSRQAEAGPIRPFTAAAAPRVGAGSEEVAASTEDAAPSLDRQVDDKIGKLLDFGEI